MDQHQFSDVPIRVWDVLENPGYLTTNLCIAGSIYWMCRVWERLV